jgi:hypothetical protein
MHSHHSHNFFNFCVGQQRHKNRESHYWVRLVVEIPGPNNRVGATPRHYPVDVVAVSAMTGPEITAFEREFNLPAGSFGVAGTTAVASRRTSVMEYLRE